MSKFWPDLINSLDNTRPVQKRIGEIMRLQLGVKTSAKEKASDAEKSPNWAHLNAVGQKAAKREAIGNFVASNAQARVALRKLRAEIKSSLPKLPGREPTDLAGVLQDQEYRAYVRGLPQEQRDRVQKMHPDIAAAVARAPAELSGVLPSVHQELVNSTLRQTHGAELARMNGDAETIKWAETLVAEADKAIREAGDVEHSPDYRAWVKPIVDPILTEAGANFDDIYRRPEPGDLDVLGVLATAADAAT